MVARANTSRIFGAWGNCAHTTTNLICYSTRQLAKPAVRIKYQLLHDEAIHQRLEVVSILYIDQSIITSAGAPVVFWLESFLKV